MILERILSCVSMRENVVWCMALAAVLAACNGKRAASEVDYAADSVFESSFGPSDSFNASSASLDEELPKRADELFDDFIFEFARLKKCPARTCRISIAFGCAGRHGMAHGGTMEI